MAHSKPSRPGHKRWLSARSTPWIALLAAIPIGAHATGSGGDSAVATGGKRPSLQGTIGDGASYLDAQGMDGRGIGGIARTGGASGFVGTNEDRNGQDGWNDVVSAPVETPRNSMIIGAGGGAGGTVDVTNTGVSVKGGKGGDGLRLDASGSSSNNDWLLGGGGGAGGTVRMLTSFAGRFIAEGGDGGAGLRIEGDAVDFLNRAALVGGGGGAGGRTQAPIGGGAMADIYDRGGAGGDGLVMAGTRAVVQNNGSILGGDGGSSGFAALGGAGGRAVLISGSDSEFINNGYIRAGNSAGVQPASPTILVTGTGNTVTLPQSSQNFGDVEIAGSGNRLRFASHDGLPSQVWIQGGLKLEAGNTLVLRAAPTAFDQLSVTGAAAVAGDVRVIASPGNYAENTQQVVLIADATLNGTRFSGVTTDLAYLQPTLAYSTDDKEVTLSLARRTVPDDDDDGGGNPPSEGGNPPPEVETPGTDPSPGPRPIRYADLVTGSNARATANAAETLAPGHPVYDAAISLAQGEPQGFFSALSGEAHAGVTAGLANLASTVRTVPLSQLRANLNAGTRPGAPTAAAGASDAAPLSAALPSSRALPAWAQIIGNWQRIGATGDTAALRQRTGGVFVGADRDVGAGWRLGGALGFTDTNLRVDDLASKADVSSYSAILHGGKGFALRHGQLNVMAGASYTWHDVDTKRRIGAGGLDQTLEASYGAHTTQVFAELGYAFAPLHALTLEPYAGVAWSGQRTRAFSESGGSAALSGASARNNTTATTLGLRATQALALGSLDGTISAGLGWRHAFGDVRPESRLAFDAGDTFTVSGAPIARNMALVEAGIDARVSRNATLGLAYGGQFGNGNRDQTATVNLRWAF